MGRRLVAFRCDENVYASFTGKANEDGKKIGEKLNELITAYLGESCPEPSDFPKTRGEMWKARAVRFCLVGDKYPNALIRLYGNTLYLPSDATVKSYIHDLKSNLILLSAGDGTQCIYAGPLQLRLTEEEKALQLQVNNQYYMLKEKGAFL